MKRAWAFKGWEGGGSDSARGGLGCLGSKRGTQPQVGWLRVAVCVLCEHTTITW